MHAHMVRIDQVMAQTFLCGRGHITPSTLSQPWPAYGPFFSHKRADLSTLTLGETQDLKFENKYVMQVL